MTSSFQSEHHVFLIQTVSSHSSEDVKQLSLLVSHFVFFTGTSADCSTSSTSKSAKKTSKTSGVPSYMKATSSVQRKTNDRYVHLTSVCKTAWFSSYHSLSCSSFILYANSE